MRQLKFPDYEYLKALPKTDQQNEPQAYEFTLFEMPSCGLRGRFSYNEDDTNWIFFDVLNGDYSDVNDLGMSLEFTELNYSIICKYAQQVFVNFYTELDTDYSYLWGKEGETIDD